MDQWLIENAGAVATALTVLATVLGLCFKKFANLKVELLKYAGAVHVLVDAIEKSARNEGSAADVKARVKAQQDYAASLPPTGPAASTVAPGIAQAIADVVSVVDPKRANKDKASRKGLKLLGRVLSVAKEAELILSVALLAAVLAGCAHTVETFSDGRTVETWAVDVDGVKAASEAAPAALELIDALKDDEDTEPDKFEMLLDAAVQIALANSIYGPTEPPVPTPLLPEAVGTGME